MKKILLYTVLIGITLMILLNPSMTIEYATHGLDICYEVIIPSLFPFFICSGLLIYSGFCDVLSHLLERFMKPIFNINGSGAAAFVLGIISGYPLGAVTACQLYKNCYLSKSEAERLLAFCNNSGPLFILGSIGISIYHSPKIGVILYVCHIIAALTVGFIFRFYKKNTFSVPKTTINTIPKSMGEIFSEVLANSIQSILTVCGAVIFFSVISRILMYYVNLPELLKPIFAGILEFVTGITMLSQSALPLTCKIIVSAAIVGFAGICVHIQVLGVVSSHMLSLKPYILGKILHALLAAVYTYIALRLFPITSEVFTTSSGMFDINASFAIGSLFTVISVASVVILCIGCALWLFFREARRLKLSLINSGSASKQANNN